MKNPLSFFGVSVFVCAVGLACSNATAELVVQSTSPLLNASNVPVTSPISVTFDRAVDTSTFTANNFRAFGKWSGNLTGPLTFSNSNRTVTLTPTRPNKAGEHVQLNMSRFLRAADGTFMRNAGYTLQYMTGVKPSTGRFEYVTTLSTRDASGNQTRIYGGNACDLNLDGWSDLSIINEVSSDIRVFMNRADGSGLFQPMNPAPYRHIPVESSPNEAVDFNRDGFVDIVTSSVSENKIAVCFGNGNGTFQVCATYNTPSYPRGFGITDADGDGDLDITVANTFGDNISLFTNNGAGVFPATPINFSSGGSNPYGMTAAEMNGDGILDLVVGHTGSQTCTILRGNGNGTFTFVSSRAMGGVNWVLETADFNNDRNMDVSFGNSGSSNGSIMLGNGNGTLQAATVYPVSGHTVGTDAMDFDGDGDQDWIVSCFGGGRWHLFTNNGTGAFAEQLHIFATANPACALPADWDNDGDVDIAFIDEIADEIQLYRNIDNCDSIDFNSDGVSPDSADIADFLSVFGGGPCSTGTCNDIDFNNDGVSPDSDDIAVLLLAFGGGSC